jgi:two-component system, NtrC family, sensor kinase
MRRGPRPAKSKVEAKPPVARKSPKDDGTRVRDLEKRLAEALGREKEGQEQQAATAEILRVISSSPADAQPVFDAIAVNALGLCDATRAVILRYDGALVHLAAHHNVDPEVVDQLERRFPAAPNRHHPTGRAILDRAVVHVPDLQAAVEFSESVARQFGAGSNISIPLLHQGRAIGAIGISRPTLGPFSDRQIALLQTFADQAVIAIENVRLFNETKEALEQQTATSEILRVISSSPTDLQPVLDAVAERAARLCNADDVKIHLVDGDTLRLAAQRGPIPSVEARPIIPTRHIGRAVLERQTIHVHDMRTALDQFPDAAADVLTYGPRTSLATPLLREGVAIGVIQIRRLEVKPFAEKQIALLETFADQAVITIQNVRLFKELQARNRDLTTALDRQTATSEILRVISSSPTDVQPVFDTIVESAVTLCDGLFGGLVRFDGELIYQVATHNYTPEALDALRRVFPARPSRTLGVGRAILERDVVHLPDVELDPEYQGQNLAGAIGFRSGLFVPMLRDGAPIGAILVARAEPGPFSDNQIALLKTFADQAVIAIENVRLFKELEGANRELSAASQHKSEFLANMSHELRTPLNAIIGFSEVLTDRMFGELNEKQEEYLKDIYASGTHLLSLINDILDLSKIEAGRMELELTDFHLPHAIENALTLVRERAGRRGIALNHSVDERLGEIRGDERKVKQLLLNLLSNALKFTPEGGRVEVRAGMVDGMAEISVTDTGVGIAPADQEAVFEEFRQVGTVDKKAEGTGLGLTLCRKFVELHGGRIWVQSQVGVGSTFTFTVPVRCGE